MSTTAFYSDQNVTIYHGDCLDILPTLTRSHFPSLVTDPPYTAAGSSTNGRNSEADSQFFRHWLRNVFEEISKTLAIESAGFVFCDWRTLGDVVWAARPHGTSMRNVGTERAFSITQALVWDREGVGMGAPFRNSFEMLAFGKTPSWQPQFGRSETNVIRHRWPYGSKEFHGAQKPVPLLEKLIRMTGGVGPVIDPFSGSGSTLLAAKRLGRTCVGVEMDERYCAIAAERCRQETFNLAPHNLPATATE